MGFRPVKIHFSIRFRPAKIHFSNEITNFMALFFSKCKKLRPLSHRPCVFLPHFYDQSICGEATGFRQ